MPSVSSDVECDRFSFPSFDAECTRLAAAVTAMTDAPASAIRVVAAPYRIAPLGAHIDHQGGAVLGMTIAAGTLLAYVPQSSPRLMLRSLNYAPEVELDVRTAPESVGGDWGRYIRGVAHALTAEYPLTRGISGVVSGMLPGGGLSSSASLILACLQALAAANDLTLGPWDYVRLTQRVENDFLGLNNGILDQASIVFGQRDTLLYIDPRARRVAFLPRSANAPAYTILVAYSGYSRELTTTGYNTRVDECRAAAHCLAQWQPGAAGRVLSDITPATYAAHGAALTTPLARRARHFFDECSRVADGVVAWQAGDLHAFGALMRTSCESSIALYECGSPAMHALQRIVCMTPGIIGARFSGGGYGGCVIAFAQPAHATPAAAAIQAAYSAAYPDAAKRAAVYLTASAPGLRVL